MAEAGGTEESPWAKGESAFTGKEYSKYFDPCQDAATRSMKCLHRNGGDRQLCTDYFQVTSLQGLQRLQETMDDGAKRGQEEGLERLSLQMNYSPSQCKSWCQVSNGASVA
ncbi:hypothetical protein N7G274_006966 [Stereocaulon virgatum]|uniref:Uncharacterized protein n=1 Tax=Stereocaulon virgatum TaxID=373712 RepID=A0ABR4A326_9LECA